MFMEKLHVLNGTIDLQEDNEVQRINGTIFARPNNTISNITR